MARIKTSLIVTFLNEENTIGKLLESIEKQTLVPDEVILVDGGSTDGTLSVIDSYLKKSRNQNKQSKTITAKYPIRIFTKKGNRSIGRNEGTKKSLGTIILITDAGCILDEHWVEKMVEHFNDPKTDVVAGYYRGYLNTFFQKALVPYVLVMPDKVKANTFLPASRSLAFKKSVWQELGGFLEKYSHNEDYVFARTLKKKGYKIVFEKDAIVYWIPPNNLSAAFVMFYRFARGDAESHMWRPKVFLIFARYILAALLIFFAFHLSSINIMGLLIILFAGYVGWAIAKNYKYVNHPSAFFYLPLFQFTSDFAVLSGTLRGIFS